MKRGDEAFNASLLQVLSIVKRFNASSLRFLLSVKRFIAMNFYRKTSFNAALPLLFKRNSSLNASSPLLFKVTLPTSAYQVPVTFVHCSNLLFIILMLHLNHSLFVQTRLFDADEQKS
jgi:hypothetical protein